MPYVSVFLNPLELLYRRWTRRSLNSSNELYGNVGQKKHHVPIPIEPFGWLSVVEAVSGTPIELQMKDSIRADEIPSLTYRIIIWFHRHYCENHCWMRRRWRIAVSSLSSWSWEIRLGLFRFSCSPTESSSIRWKTRVNERVSNQDVGSYRQKSVRQMSLLRRTRKRSAGAAYGHDRFDALTSADDDFLNHRTSFRRHTTVNVEGRGVIQVEYQTTDGQTEILDA